MIVVDASALVAIGDEEADADELLRCVIAHDAVISSINYVETGIVLIGRRRLVSARDLDEWLRRLGVDVYAATDLSKPALHAYLTYGRGHHRARLNLADCYAYALAKEIEAPLLFKGDDFALTDIRPALQPT
jgi:ribonuclease VapC